MVPNGLGAFYVLISVAYLFVVYSLGEQFGLAQTSNANGISATLTLAACILFGGFMGLLDDWIDVKWRYKAFLPLIAAIPLASLASKIPGIRTSMSVPILGTIDFGIYYFLLVIPLLVTIITNTVNQLGGLNGLETVCPAIVMMGLMFISGSNAIFLYGPLAVWLVLAIQNVRGKIFVGNTGSFAVGMTLAAFATISNVKVDLVISILPYVLNSSLILLTFFFSRKKASVSFDGKRLTSNHVRSLITLVTYRRQLTEQQVVAIISILIAVTTSAALMFHWLFL